jgi:hypothetical protein
MSKPIASVMLVALVSVAPQLSTASGMSKDAPCALLQQERAEFVATSVRNFLAGIEAHLNFVSLPDQGGAEQRRVEFLKLLRTVPAITEVGRVDATGIEEMRISRFAMDTRGKDRSKEPAFVNAKAGTMWLSAVHFRQEREPYVTMAVRGHGDQGSVTIAEVNLKFLWDVISNVRVGAKGKAYVVDGRGLLVADPSIALVMAKSELAANPIVSQVLSSPARSGTLASGGADALLVGFATIDPIGWKVIAQEPMAAR